MSPYDSFLRALPQLRRFLSIAALVAFVAACTSSPASAQGGGPQCTVNTCGGYLSGGTNACWLTHGNLNECRAPEGCFCDELCVSYDDCCPNYAPACETLYVFDIAPSSGPTIGGTEVRIRGRNFGEGAFDQTHVYLGAVEQTILSATLNEIVFVTSGGVGAQAGRVERGDTGEISETFEFSYVDIPQISPTIGPVEGGTRVTISGSNFGLYDPAISRVLLGGVAQGVLSWTDTEIVFVTAAGTGTNLPVVVRTADGDLSSYTPFSYELEPQVAEMSPTSGTAAGGTEVTLRGTDFGTYDPQTCRVVLGQRLQRISSWTDTEIVFVTMGGPAGDFMVFIGTVTDQQSNPVLYSYDDAPYLHAMTPTVGSISGGDQIALSGWNFGPYVEGVSRVLLGDVEQDVLSWTDTDVSFATVGAQASGAYPVVVHTNAGLVSNGIPFAFGPAQYACVDTGQPDVCANRCEVFTGTCGCDRDCFRYGDCCCGIAEACLVPTVSAVTPSSGPSYGASLVMITGSNFLSGSPGVGLVTIGGSPQSIVSWTNSNIVIETSPGLGIDLPVSVRSTMFLANETSPVSVFSYVDWLSTVFDPVHVPAIGYGAALGLVGLLTAIAVRRLNG